MKNNTGRNIFLIVLGYYLLTGNYKAARNFVLAYVAMILILGLVFLGSVLANDAKSSREEAYQHQLQAEQNKKDLQEAEQFAADVLPAFVKQFKGKTQTGQFYDSAGLDGYSLKFQILNDSTLTYQICEDGGLPGGSFGMHKKWSKKKKTTYSVVPAIRDNGSAMKETLIFKFDSYHGELGIMKSKKKKKYLISTPLTLEDADNLYGVFWEL